MNSFVYYNPTKVIFGRDAEKQTAKEIIAENGKKVLIHYGGKSAESSGLLGRVRESLKAAGIPFCELPGVRPNPRLSLVYEGIALCRREGVDFILAIGGGSAIDSAKAIATGLANPETDIWDFFLRKKTTNKSVPVGVIVTIAAAGSETGYNSVLTNEENHQKRSMNNDGNRPRFAVMNPELTFTLPPYQTACGVADIMMHTLERYFARNLDNELSDAFAEALLRVVVKNGTEVMKNPEDYHARSEILWAGSVSHCDITGLGAVRGSPIHKLGHVLSAKFDATHGATLTAMWKAWAYYELDANVPRFAQYAVNVFGVIPEGKSEREAAVEGIDRTTAYFASLGLPTNIKDLCNVEFTDEKFREFAYECLENGTQTTGNMMVLDLEDVVKIYAAAAGR